MTDLHQEISTLRTINAGLAQRIAALEATVREKEAAEALLHASEAREAHIKQVLLAIRNVNQLIVQVTDPRELSEKACSCLTETLGYFSAWIALFGADATTVYMVAASGFPAGFAGMDARLKRGEFPAAMRSALAQDTTVLLTTMQDGCPADSLTEATEGRNGFVRRLAFAEKVYGVLVVSVPARFAMDEEERALFTEVATDLGFALHKIEETVALRENTRLLASLMNNLPGMVYQCAHDSDWTMSFVSAGVVALTGYTSDDFVVQRRVTYASLVVPPEREAVWAAIQAAIAAHESFELEYRIRSAAGQEKWVWEHGQGVFAPDGQLLHLEGFITDITERKRADEKLQQTENFYRALIEHAPDGVVLIRGQDFVYMSPSVKRLFGYDLTDTIGTPDGLTHPDDLPYVLAALQRVIADPTWVPTVQYRFKHKDGAWCWLESTFSNLLAVEGVAGLVVNFRDITTRRMAELGRDVTHTISQLFLLSESLESIFDELPQILAVRFQFPIVAIERYDPVAGEMVFVGTTGIVRNDMTPIRVALDQTISGSVASTGQALFEVNALARTEYQFTALRSLGVQTFLCVPINTRSGVLGTLSLADPAARPDTTWILNTLQVIANHLGQEIERRRVEETLRENEALLRAIIDNIPFEFWARDREERCFMENALLVRHWGSILGMRPEDASVTPEEQANWKAKNRRVLDGEVDVIDEEVAYVVEGQQRIFQSIIAPIRTGNVIHGVLGLSIDITDRKRAEEALEAEHALLAERVEARTAELRIANAELARAARLKDEFLANMSHELRTPLNDILGRAELLQEAIYGPVTPKQVESLRSVEASGRHLLALITDILDLSKIEADKLTLHIDTVAVALICQASLHMVTQSAMKKQIALSFALDAQVATLQADERRLKQILVNLLTNAVKFTHAGGQVGLDVVGDTAQQTVTFTVWDTGIGIADEHRARLFQPFSQIDSGLNRQYTGTGLGLSLVQRLTQAHGGTITLTSTPNQGSRFSVILPWSSAPPTSSATTAVDPLPIRSPRTPADLQTQRILLVEDNDANSHMIEEFLHSHGYTVIIARNGFEAIDALSSEVPQLLLMDIQLPGIDGLTAIRRIRGDRSVPRVPIIALTALTMPGDRERFLAAGVDAYLAKPVSLRVLLATISSLLPVVGASEAEE